MAEKLESVPESVPYTLNELFLSSYASGPKVINIFQLINVKMPTMVGISIFVSSKSSILHLSEPENAEFLDIFIHVYI